MTESTLLRVILSDHAVRKLTLPHGIPSTVEELQLAIRDAFTLFGNFCLHMDADFGNEYFTLLSTNDIKDKDTIKVVYIDEPTVTLTLSSVDNTSDSDFSSPPSTQPLDNTSLLSSDDTATLSPSSNGRTMPWPDEFPVPRFSLSTEVLLSSGNQKYISSGTLFCSKELLTILPDILSQLAETIFEYSAYPSSAHLSQVAEALVQKHPCLKEPGSFNGCYGWIQRLKYKMNNFRSKLRGIGYPELTVNSLKRKAAHDQTPAKNIKKPRKAEVNYLPPHPQGETSDSLEKERQDLLMEVTKRDSQVLTEKMERTFSLRREEILYDEPAVRDFMHRWPALFNPGQVNEEFRRITTVSLESTFMAQLDLCTPKLMEVASTRGGAAGVKIRGIKDLLLQSNSIDVRREVAIRSLIVYLGEKEDNLFKHFNDTEDFESHLQDLVMNIAIIGNTENRVAAIVIEGTKVIEENSIPRCCTLLMGLIYALNLC